MATKDDVLTALRQVIDAEHGDRDIVALGYVREVKQCGEVVAVDLELPNPASVRRESLVAAAREAIAELPDVREVKIDVRPAVKEGPTAGHNRITGVKNVVAVASGKGGVGKSTVAVNLAVALAQSGASVGLMDADVYGPSVPIMMGVHQRPEGAEDGRIEPLERFGVRMMSIGFLADPGQAVIWRGPMVAKLLSQFITDVHWGELDYLLIDLPPGTGDAQLTLVQSAPLSGAVVVTTPQDVALEDVTRAIGMFEKTNVAVLGVVENMSYHVCSKCGHREEIFAHGGGRRAAEQFGAPFLGEIPLDLKVREGGDAGAPITHADPDSPVAAVWRDMAAKVAEALLVLAVEESRQGVEIRFV